MIKRHLYHIIGTLLTLSYLIFFYGGLLSVPFHPDKSTQIFMSGDFQTMFTNPSGLFFDPAKLTDTRQHYRLVDAPLARTAVGKGLTLTGLPPLPQDWDWGVPWDQNIAAGTYPSSNTLLIARLFTSLFFPLGLAAFFLTLRSFTGKWISLAGVAFLAINSLILLHTRRAMAEPLFITIFLLLIWRLSKPFSIGNIIWISILLGLFLQAKQLALPLVVAVMTILLWKGWQKLGWRSLHHTLLLPAGCILLFLYISNPVMWKDPVQVAPIMLEQRQMVSQNQLEVFRSAGSNLALTTPAERVIAMVAHTYLAPPAYYDIANYRESLAAGIASYSKNPLNLVLSGWIWGGIFLTLTLTSLILFGIRLFRRPSSQPEIVAISIWMGFVQFAGYFLFLPLGFQRYYLVFIPLSLLMCIYGIQQIFPKDTSR